MTSEFGRTAELMAVVAARVSLDDLMAWVGVDGLVAALRSPGLMAEVDQHAAAVRDELGEHVTSTRALAEYAREVHAAALFAGHRMPEPSQLDFSNAPAHILRLVAVCALAESEDCL